MRHYFLPLIIPLLLLTTFFRNEVWCEPGLLWRDVVKKSPLKQRGYLNLGIALMELKRYSESLECYRQAIELNPFSKIAVLAWYNTGRVYLYEARYEEAVQTMSTAIRADSLCVKAYVGRAVANIEKGLIEQAENDLMIAKRLNPSDANIYYNMGRIYMERGMYDDAINAYSETIKLKPEFARAYNNRGVAYAEKGSLPLAYVDFKKALGLDPNFHEASQNLKKIAAAFPNFSTTP